MAEQTVTEERGATDGNEGLAHLAGRYLTFCLGDEFYGANVLKVSEIIGLQDITRVPDTEPYLKGVINLRGQVIAVMDLRLRFGMPEAPATEETCVIIVEAQGTMTGIIADCVQEVVDLAPREIEPPAQFGNQVDTGFILGMGKFGDRIILMIDSDKVVSVPARHTAQAWDTMSEEM